MAPSFANLKNDYAALWGAMQVRVDRKPAADAIARRLLNAKPRYKSVEARTGVPWYVIACIHERESGQDWGSSLAQGDPWNRVSTHVPRGRGPFSSWEDAAVDALRLDGLDQVTDWSAESICYEFETFNGFGYRSKGVNSPYLWSWSNDYTAGKYVADGVFSPSAVDQQCGTMVMLTCLMALDSTIDLKAPAIVKPLPKPVTKPPVARRPVHPGQAVGGIAAALAAASVYFQTHPIVPIVLFVAAVGGFVWYMVRRNK